LFRCVFQLNRKLTQNKETTEQSSQTEAESKIDDLEQQVATVSNLCCQSFCGQLFLSFMFPMLFFICCN